MPTEGLMRVLVQTSERAVGLDGLVAAMVSLLVQYAPIVNAHAGAAGVAELHFGRGQVTLKLSAIVASERVTV